MSTGQTAAPSFYKGLAMRCAPGTHEAAMEMILRQNLPKSSALDLASGAGAFIARLRDHGYTDVCAVELDAAKFQCRDITPLSLDLNHDFAAAFNRSFNLVCAIEIIEHLDNPRHFLRQIRTILADGGHVLVSTPNVADLAGRAKFLLTGELRYFDEAQYRFNHHINPITDTQMRLMLHETGFDLVENITAGDFSGPAKRRCMAPVRWLARLVLRCLHEGEVNIYLARKAPAERHERPTDWTDSSS